MWQAYCYSFLLLILLAYDCQGIPADDSPQPMEFGLKLDPKTQDARKGFELTLTKYSENETYLQRVRNWRNETLLEIRIEKSSLRLYDNVETWRINCIVVSNSTVPLVVSYDLDSTHAVKFQNSSWYWLPDGNNKFSIPVHILTQQIGLSYLRFWVREAIRKNYTLVQSYELNSSNEATNHYFSSVIRSSTVVNDTALLGFPVIVLRGQGVVQIVFRIVVVTMVTIFTFTMGCELDPELLRMYARRPIGPAIGFCCQFIIMPLLAFTIGMLIPIKTEFSFGLLTVGCSPGGGASNAWSLMLGGDINLSILMTFISSLSALFMMPLLLFALGRFFIDVNQVQIPYGNICIQLLQITIPAILGLGLRFWKPKAAKWFTKLTRPLFLFFILFFLTFGIYANLSIFKLIGSYPIVIPTGALLPWFGFVLAALTAFILRQPRPAVITIALETGIQNIGAAVLVLLYSMPQPAGDLGAVMPITVSLFTPIPLYFILLGVTIKKRCCKQPAPVEIHEVQALNQEEHMNKTVDDLLDNHQKTATRV